MQKHQEFHLEKLDKGHIFWQIYSLWAQTLVMTT
jgi:hypothetical protein